MQRTLTGFDQTPKTANEWQQYISDLYAARQVVVIKFRAIPAPTLKQRMAAMSRYDVLSEHIARAEDERMKGLPE